MENAKIVYQIHGPADNEWYDLVPRQDYVGGRGYQTSYVLYFDGEPRRSYSLPHLEHLARTGEARLVLVQPADAPLFDNVAA